MSSQQGVRGLLGGTILGSGVTLIALSQAPMPPTPPACEVSKQVATVMEAQTSTIKDLTAVTGKKLEACK